MTPVNRVIAPTRLFITDRMEIIPGRSLTYVIGYDLKYRASIIHFA